MGKIAFRPWPKNRKWEKLCFGHGRRTENGKNRPSSADEMQKTMKIVCRRPTKARITHFLRFQPLGKSESLIFCVSNPLEKQNHSFFAFPTPWKAKITHFLRFQPLGKAKSPIFCVSNPLEKQNHPFSAFPTPWKVRITHFLRFQPLGKAKSPIFCVSNPLESQNYSFFAFPTPWKARKREKTAFHPRMTSEKQRKQRFIHG